MTKSICYYDPGKFTRISLGGSALIFPLTHYSRDVSLTKHILTSQVIFYDPESGEFETQNTIYKPKLN